MSDSSSNHPSGGDGSYVVVARRYRPRGFDELVGQDHVGRALKNAIETSRVGHAYLFTGARGVGKTSTARIFAKALNDPRGPTPTPDNTSDVALAIDAGEDVDVIEIDGASNRGIDEIRSLRANVGVRPSRSRFKIYIIDEVHMLTGAAFNALLKTLEEPPQHVKFIFCTTDPEKIPITVLSRCQRFDFAPVEVSKIVTRLREIVTAESAEADDTALELIARRAAGSMRDSQSLLEQVLSFSDGKLTAHQVHAMLGTADEERLHCLARAMADRDAAEAMRQMDQAIDVGVDAGRLAEQLLGYFRDLMAVTVGCDASLQRHTSASLHEELKELGQRWGLQTVLAVVGLIDQTLVRIRHSVYPRVLLESTLMQICSLPDLQGLADLAAAAASKTTLKPPAGEKKKRPINPPHVDASGTATTSPSHHRPAATAVSATAEAMPGSTSPAITGRAPSERPSALAVMEPETTTGVATDTPKSSPRQSHPEPVKTEPTALAAGVQSDVNPLTTPEASAHGSREKPFSSAQSTGLEEVPVWDQPTAERIWHSTLAELESMTETFARVAEKVHAVGKDKLRVVFPADATLAMKRCELPEHKTALTDAVSRLTGKPITLEIQSAPPKGLPIKEEPAVSKPSRLQRMREIESNEFVKSCVDLFDAEIVRIDKPN